MFTLDEKKRSFGADRREMDKNMRTGTAEDLSLVPSSADARGSCEKKTEPHNIVEDAVNSCRLNFTYYFV